MVEDEATGLFTFCDYRWDLQIVIAPITNIDTSELSFEFKYSNHEIQCLPWTEICEVRAELVFPQQSQVEKILHENLHELQE